MRQPEINIAEKAAFKAGGALLRLQKQANNLHVSKRKDNDFITVAKNSAKQAIIETIAKAYADHAIMNKDGSLIGNQKADHIWIIDPLNGADNFLHGIPHYAISLALEVKGVTQHALIHDPARDETFYASKGYGAFIENVRAKMDLKAELNQAIIATELPHIDRKYFNRYMLQFKSIFKAVRNINNLGCSVLDMAYVATGRVDGFWQMGLNKHEISAGSLIINEAGGDCMDFSLEKNYTKTGNLIAGNLNIIAALQNKIKASMP